MTVSELKQPWSVLLQRKNSAILRAETAIIKSENLWSLLKTTDNRLTFMKTSERLWESLKTPLNIYENFWSSMKIMKISSSLTKRLNITKNLWELLVHIWNGLKTYVAAL